MLQIVKWQKFGRYNLQTLLNQKLSFQWSLTQDFAVICVNSEYPKIGNNFLKKGLNDLKFTSNSFELVLFVKMAFSVIFDQIFWSKLLSSTKILKITEKKITHTKLLILGKYVWYKCCSLLKRDRVHLFCCFLLNIFWRWKRVGLDRV